MSIYHRDANPAVRPSNLADRHMLDVAIQVYTTSVACSSEPSVYVIPFLPDEQSAGGTTFFSPLFFTEDGK